MRRINGNSNHYRTLLFFVVLSVISTLLLFSIFRRCPRSADYSRKISLSADVFSKITADADGRLLRKFLNQDSGPFLLPNNTMLNMWNEQQLLQIYWKYINNIQVLCHNQERLGSMIDGGKEICVDKLYKPRDPCLVYSFGSNFQFDFELDIYERFKCDIHTFDPSHKVDSGRKIPTHLNFYLTGLWDETTTNKDGWHMETLSSIRERLDHKTRTIDILKIDIEGSEWTAFPQMFKSGVLRYVKQICLEVHVGKIGKKGSERKWGDTPVVHTLKVLRTLHEAGFHIFMREHNLYVLTKLTATRLIPTVNEISLINVNYRAP